MYKYLYDCRKRTWDVLVPIMRNGLRGTILYKGVDRRSIYYPRDSKGWPAMAKYWEATTLFQAVQNQKQPDLWRDTPDLAAMVAEQYSDWQARQNRLLSLRETARAVCADHAARNGLTGKRAELAADLAEPAIEIDNDSPELSVG